MAEMSFDQAMALARTHLQAKRLAEAEALCRAVLEQSPDEPEALRLWGLAALYGGNLEKAEELLRRLIRVAPQHVDSHNNLSVALWHQHRPKEAEAAARQALALDPANLAAWNNLGNALQGQRRFEEAAEAYRKILATDPKDARAANNLGTALQSLGQFQQAVEAHRRAIALQPGFANALTNLGVALNELGQFEEAIATHRRALEFAPQSPQVHHNLSSVLLNLGRWSEAEAVCRQALTLQPRYPKALCNLAAVLTRQYRYAEAESTLRQVVSLEPHSGDALSRLGNLLMEQGRPEEAILLHRRAVELDSGNSLIHEKALLCEQYIPGVTVARLAEAHAVWARHQVQTSALPRRSWPNSLDSERPLRLGFLSSDLGNHPVGYFLIGVIENLDRCQATAICYNDRASPDALNARFRAAADQWREVKGLSHPEVADLIRQDQIDILFDLAGPTSQRLPVFAARAAPIQMTWIGYVGTTGLPSMDYVVADARQVLPGTEESYCEKIFRLPDGYVCFDPPSEAPLVGPLPADRNGSVTFGSFNNLVKVNSQVIALWARILQRVPNSRLMLKFFALADPTVRSHFTRAFSAHGIDSPRLLLSPGCPRAEFLAHYNQIDIALDTFPYGGGLTTCEALWMGVPVITCPGETFASRHALGHLTNVGLTLPIARDFQHYADLAVELAADLPRLGRLRSSLRSQVAASPLCDPKQFAGNLAMGLRQIWREWLSRAE